MPKRVQLATDPHGLTGMNDFTAADRGRRESWRALQAAGWGSGGILKIALASVGFAG
jgi:hypothetical protein